MLKFDNSLISLSNAMFEASSSIFSMMFSQIFFKGAWKLNVCLYACVYSQESDILLQKYMIKCEKNFPSINKETQGMQRLDCPPLHQNALHTENHQRNRVITISFTLAKDDTKMFL